MVRFATNVLLTGLAIALLGILVLLSTQADEAVRRQADLNLRQLRDIAAAIEREALNARNLQTDNDAQLQALGSDLHARVEAIGHDLPSCSRSMSTVSPAREPSRKPAFNSIDPRKPERAEAEPLLRTFAELNQSAARLSDQIEGFREQSDAVSESATSTDCRQSRVRQTVA